MKKLLQAALSALAITLPLNTFAAPQQGICEFSKGYQTTMRKTCAMDSFNSGLIQLITNNGTLNFKLHDSRLDQYSLDGEIWHLKGNNIWQGGTFTLGRDPSRTISWQPFN